jgi:hypothetical protein
VDAPRFRSSPRDSAGAGDSSLVTIGLATADVVLDEEVPGFRDFRLPFRPIEVVRQSIGHTKH